MIKKPIYRLIVFSHLFLSYIQHAKSQDYPVTLQYTTNMFTINPAYMGMNNTAGFMSSTRIDNTSINGSAIYRQLSFRAPIRSINSGIGINVIHRNIGKEKQLYCTFDYSYQIRLSMKSYLRFGLKAGVVNYRNNLTDYQLYPDGFSDSQFMTDVKNYYMTVWGAGVSISNENYCIGLSVPQFINNTYKVNSEGYSSLAELKTGYISGEYMLNILNGIRVKPVILLIITVDKPLLFDVGAVSYLPKHLDLGLHVSKNGDFCFSGQYLLNKNIKVGFATDYPVFHDISKYNLGTYELIVGYQFETRPNRGRRLKR
jgi:type IX secretion system PorP/SprF family membrane protein